MTCVTRRLGPALAAALVVVTGAACDSGEDIAGGPGKGGSRSDKATDAPAVQTLVTLQNVGKRLDDVHRQRLKSSMAEVLDPYFEGAFLGAFPRDDYAAAFARFTPGAAADARRDLDVLSSASLGDQIEEATATKRRVRVDVFAVDGHPRGVTAHFVLEFDTRGELERTMRVRGDLFLTKHEGQWQVFGYDVDQAEAL